MWSGTETALLLDESGDFLDPVLLVLCRQCIADESRSLYCEVGFTDDNRFQWIDFPLLNRRLMEIQTLVAQEMSKGLDSLMSSNSDLDRSLRTEVASALKDMIHNEAKQNDYTFPLPDQNQSSGPNRIGPDGKDATLRGGGRAAVKITAADTKVDDSTMAPGSRLWVLTAPIGEAG
jgi:hypothetical protein